jgi:hypothetical protein
VERGGGGGASGNTGKMSRDFTVTRRSSEVCMIAWEMLRQSLMEEETDMSL